MRYARLSTIAALLALGMAGCSDRETGEPQALASRMGGNGTVAGALSEQRDLRRLASAMNDTQLAPVFDGKGDYTILAPTDAAFAALGAKGEALATKDRQPVLVAILRGHVLPGVVTPKAIAAAIERKKGPVEMMTMAGKAVTFAQSHGRITVSNGATTAKLSDTPGTVSNGAILPIDKVLMPAG